MPWTLSHPEGRNCRQQPGLMAVRMNDVSTGGQTSQESEIG
jgi:hypothetical protein